jgi:hypothetical protein
MLPKEKQRNRRFPDITGVPFGIASGKVSGILRWSVWCSRMIGMHAMAQATARREKAEKAARLAREVTDALTAAYLKGLADEIIAKAEALKCATNSDN